MALSRDLKPYLETMPPSIQSIELSITFEKAFLHSKLQMSFVINGLHEFG